jgi:hypothetical protein
MFGAESVMVERRSVEPAAFQEGVALMCHRVEALAGHEGIRGAEYFDLQRVLLALLASTRRRAGVMLDGIAVSSFDKDPAVAFAARYVRALAGNTWDSAHDAPERRQMAS